MAIQIQLRRGLASEWTSANPVLAEGEMGVELDTLLFKIGDGVQNWNDLEYGAEGPAGADGADGADGKTILNGTGAPGGGLGTDDDFYLDTAASRLYGPKTGGVWGSGVSLIGPAGADGVDGTDGADGANGTNGNTVRSGTGAPGGGLGVDGDFYIDTDADTIYGPKTGGAWGSPTSIVGPQGDQGIQGAQGDPELLSNTVSTTDATVTDLITKSTSSDSLLMIDARVVTRRASNGDVAGFFYKGLFKNVGGTLTLVDEQVLNLNQALLYTVSGAVSGTTAKVQVTGVAAHSLSWASKHREQTL